MKTVYKHRFMYTNRVYNEEQGVFDIHTHGVCILEFIVEDVDFTKLKENAKITMKDLSGKTSRTKTGLPLYDFGNLRAKDCLNDIHKVFRINCNYGGPMHLWLDESPRESYWFEA